MKIKIIKQKEDAYGGVTLFCSVTNEKETRFCAARIQKPAQKKADIKDIEHLAENMFGNPLPEKESKQFSVLEQLSALDTEGIKDQQTKSAINAIIGIVKTLTEGGA